MLSKKDIKNILLEVEASCYHYEKYLNEIIEKILNKKNSDIKYLVARENNYNYLTLYKYSQLDFTKWLLNELPEVENISELINNYSLIYEYIQKNYIDYYVEENILNFINVTKFRKKLYNDKALLNTIINNIRINVKNYANNKYLIKEYNLNKKLYKELLKI